MIAYGSQSRDYASESIYQARFTAIVKNMDDTIYRKMSRSVN